MRTNSFSRWLKVFSFVSKLLNDNGVEHVFIKVLVDPYPSEKTNDIDILISDASEERKALEVLGKHGFRFTKSRFPNHPLKVVSWGAPPIEIYPDTIWSRRKVSNGGEIVAKRVLSDVKGIKAYLPPPDYSFYLIATHAFFHEEVSLVEVLNAISLISNSNFSWSRVYKLARDFGTIDSVYFFLRAITLESDSLDKDILSTFSRHKVCRFVDIWFERHPNPTFPLKIPTWLGCFVTCFSHTPTLIGKITVKELFFDFLSHYVR